MNIEKALNLAINNTILEGITDVELFSRPFELDMLKDKTFRQNVFEKLLPILKSNDINKLQFLPLANCLVPKKDFFAFRKCALIDPLDEIKYLTLVIMLAELIEKNRDPKRNNRIFSYRWQPAKGHLFSGKYNFTAFRSYVQKQSQKRNVHVVAECDIANFYDRINLHRLECILSSFELIDTKYVKTIDALLKFWANRDSYGLPVGSNASRILAEAALIEVDKYLISHNVNFCRFVDDFRFFAPDAATAHYWLSLLVTRLNKEGLCINSSKTLLRDVSKELKNISVSCSLVKSTQKEQEDHSAISKIIRGYSGFIPTKFRNLRKNEIEKFKTVNIETHFSELKKTELIEPKKFIECVKICAAQNSSQHFCELVTLTKKFPQFLPLILDAILKNIDIFCDGEKKNIIEVLEQTWLHNATCSEYIHIYVVKFLGHPKIAQKDILFSFFKRLTRNQGNYIGRAILEQITPFVERGQVLEIRDYFLRADIWEKRQIAKMVSMHLINDEKVPYFKNLRAICDDIYIQNIEKFFKKSN